MSATPEQVPFDGRFLFLSDHADVMDAQLAGEDVTLEQALPLRDDVSTDEMTSQVVCAKFEDNYGAGLPSAYRAGTQLPIAEHALENYGAAVIVAGKRFGKGFSREHSPMAVRDVGVRLIVAESPARTVRAVAADSPTRSRKRSRAPSTLGHTAKPSMVTSHRLARS